MISEINSERKDFWTTEPCDWTITNYLTKLIAQDPALTRRSASNRLINDATIIKNHVIAGTIAETMASTMASSLQVREKKTFNAFFVSHANQMTQETLKYGVQKTRLKSAMTEQVANEEEKENARKRPMDGNDCEEGPSRRTRASRRKVFTVIDDNQTSEQGDDDDRNDSGDDKKDSIWEEWKQFLDNQENMKCFMQLSPEMHKVIWCGKLVRRRNCLPPELYDKLNQEIPLVTMQDINPCLAEMSNAVFDAESNTEMQSCIELLNCIVLDDPVFIAEKKLIVDICRTLNDYIFDNCGLECMMATTKYLRNVNHDITFFPGEIELNSMTTQLKQKGMNDGRYKYNADGTLMVNNFSAIGILLTEVSSGYGSNEAGKISFDHYKAMFGMLAMIRTVAQLYDKVSFNTFTKLKIHFLHAHGNSIRHWSMSTQAPGIYIMTKEQRVNVPISFSEKDITILPFICFFKTLA
ncbi:hypothetical protein G6F42_017151 [Rhizopus arrhizus]|nr:hypothetical protein G6F42_017151 [Rhizopus arrhizus]